MNRLRQAVAAWLRRTEADPHAVARVRARLEFGLGAAPEATADPHAEASALDATAHLHAEAASLTATTHLHAEAAEAATAHRAAPSPAKRLLHVLPDPSRRQMARVRRRLESPPPPRRSVARPALGLAFGGLLAGGLAALLLVPARLDVPLEGGRAQDLGPLVVVMADGRGTAAGTERAPRLTWEAGTLDVDVLPGRGADVEIETPEARVRVVGTVFSVTRDRLGTGVRVRRGAVEVACVDEPPVRLAPGDEHTCAPTTAAGLLGRAQALLDAGDHDAARLAAERGLSVADSGPARTELGLAHLEALVRLGRHAEALVAAEALLAEERAAAAPAVATRPADPAAAPAAPTRPADPAAATHTRTPDIRRLAAAAARPLDGCDGVRRWLAPLSPDERDVADLVALADCEPDPGLARPLLDAAAALATDPRHAEAIRVRLDRLTPEETDR